MTKATSPLPVIFRAERSGDFKGHVTAVFPTEPGTPDPWTFTIYAHVGQHGTGSKEWYWATRAATPAESADLLRELRGIYEAGEQPTRLVVCKRFTRHHDAARKAAIRNTGRAA